MGIFVAFASGLFIGGIAGIIFKTFEKEINDVTSYEPDFTWQ